MLVKLRYDGPVSNVAFNFNLRRYSKGSRMMCVDMECRCPALFPGGDDCDEARAPSTPWCLTPLPTWQRLTLVPNSA
jgi:hypothetical protein